MGLCVASELFQEKITRNLHGIKNVKVAMDDILIFGRTQLEHDEALEALLERLVELNLTVGEDKCEFNQEEITFYGMVISKMLTKFQDYSWETAQQDSFDKIKTAILLTSVQPYLGIHRKNIFKLLCSISYEYVF